MEELELNIKEQISKINQSFKYYWTILDEDDENIKSLGRTLKKVSIYFKLWKIVSIPPSCLLVIIPIVNGLSDSTFFDLNKGSLLPAFTIVFLLNTYRSYKVKVNLENKIYLLDLLDKIEKK
jgi:hypothetical protein